MTIKTRVVYTFNAGTFKPAHLISPQVRQLPAQHAGARWVRAQQQRGVGHEPVGAGVGRGGAHDGLHGRMRVNDVIVIVSSFGHGAAMKQSRGGVVMEWRRIEAGCLPHAMLGALQLL